MGDPLADREGKLLRRIAELESQVEAACASPAGCDEQRRIAELEAENKAYFVALEGAKAELAALNKGIGALVMAAGGEVTITEYMLVKDIEVEWYREPADDSQVIRARWTTRAEEGGGDE